MRSFLILAIALFFSTASEATNYNTSEVAANPPITITGGTFTLSEDCMTLTYSLTVCLQISLLNPPPTATMQVEIFPFQWEYIEIPMPNGSAKQKYIYTNGCTTVNGTYVFDEPVAASLLSSVTYNNWEILADGVYIEDFC